MNELSNRSPPNSCPRTSHKPAYSATAAHPMRAIATRNLRLMRCRPRLTKHLLLRYPLAQHAIASPVPNLEATAVPIKRDGTKPVKDSNCFLREATSGQPAPPRKTDGKTHIRDNLYHQGSASPCRRIPYIFPPKLKNPSRENERPRLRIHVIAYRTPASNARAER